MAELINRIVNIANKKTSMRLADAEWRAVDLICDKENVKKGLLFELINKTKDADMGFTYAVRLFVIIYLHHTVYKKQKPNYGAQKRQSPCPVFYAIKGIL